MDNVPKPPVPRPYPAIPYGRAHFKGIRLEGALYVDKTRFLHGLENRRYVFFIRHRRFGKSCWISLLESYYGRHEADAFNAVFHGTDIGREATPNHSRHVVLRFNFSAFNNALETLERNFESYCRITFADALAWHPDIFPEDVAERLCGEATINDKLMALFAHCRRHGIPLCILIDEYDNFANTILAERGAEAYHSFTHGGGFYRSFFATLKAGAERDSVDRLFITGVSPVTMDDVTSGFNIGTNISLLPEFNELLGFTEAEVRGMLAMYRDLGVFNQDEDETLGLMREWYNGYRFAEDAENAVYNTDMVLFYLDHSLPNKRGPRRLIDVNARIDYTKLRHLLLTEQRLNGNFDLLGEAASGARIDCELAESFPLAALARRENFLSLMHCFGLLSIQGANAGVASLGVPNQTVRQLLYGHLRDAFRDVGVFHPDFVALDRLTRRMAQHGEWRPFINALGQAVREHTGIRDYLHGEKVVQTFLAAYLSIAGYFVLRTEVELGKGYADLVAVPLTARFPGMRSGFVIELKYLGRAARDESRISALGGQAESQLRAYLADERLRRLHPDVAFTGLALVFRGWELAYAAEVTPGSLRTTTPRPLPPRY